MSELISDIMAITATEMAMQRLTFSIELKRAGIVIADIEGTAQIDFNRVGAGSYEPEIFLIDIDGIDDKGDSTQRRLTSDDWLHKEVSEAIWKQYEDRLYDMADEYERGRVAHDREVAAAE